MRCRCPRRPARSRGCRRSGVTCVIATGRMLTSARRIAEQLGISAPLVCYQGAMVGTAGRRDPPPRPARHPDGARSPDRDRASRLRPGGLHRRARLRRARVRDRAHVLAERRRRLPGGRGARALAAGPRHEARHLGRAGRDERAPRRPAPALRQAGVHREEPAVLPRDGGARGVEGDRRRPRLRAPRHRRRSSASRSATARTTSSCSTGPATAWPSATASSRSGCTPTGSVRRSPRTACRGCSRRSPPHEQV